MNPLLNSNPTKVYKEYITTGKINLPLPYTKNYKLFIEHMLSFFAKIPLYQNATKISMYKTLTNIPAEGIEGMSLQDIQALVKLSSKVPRSRLVMNMSRNKENARLGSLTPLFMYAHKLYNNVSYTDWDKTDKYIGIALGTFLEQALEFELSYPALVPINSVQRTILLGNRRYTDYPRYLKLSHTTDPTETVGETIDYPKEWLILSCQFWLANRDLRDTKSMLLNVGTFGAVPKALDAGPKLDKKEEPIISGWL